MGPIHALVTLAEKRGLHPFVEQIESTDKHPLMALHVDEGGSARCEPLKPGKKVPAFRKWARAGTVIRPRPFRDDAKITLDQGPHRRTYADLVHRMLARHPKSSALRAFHAFLLRKEKAPKSWYVDKPQIKAEYIPFYRGRPVIEAVLRDYDGADMDPYGDGPFDGRVQSDVFTGEPCIVPHRRPVRILGLGASSGVSLISCNDPVTAHHWTADPKLAVPMGERTMHLHGAALQDLVINDESYFAASRGDESLRYFCWTREDDRDAAKLVVSLMRGQITLQEVEDWATLYAESDDDLCVLGVIGSKRLAIMNWHHLPLREAVQNVSAYAHNHVWGSPSARGRSKRKVMGLTRIAQLSLPYHICMDDNGSYSWKRTRQLLDNSLEWQSYASLVDYLIEADSFPWVLREHIQRALLQQDNAVLATREENLGAARSHVRDQLQILERHATPVAV